MEDRVDVIITGGGISPTVEKKILGIAAAAELAAGAVAQLQKSISMMLPGLRDISRSAPVTARSIHSAANATVAFGKASKGLSSTLASNAAAFNATSAAAVRYRASVGASALPGMGGAQQSAGTVAAMAAVGAATDKTKRSVISLGAVLRTLFLLYFAAAAAQRILTLADSFTELSNKLNVVTGSAAETDRVMSQLLRVAQESRTSLDATVVLYQRLSLGMRHLNVTGNDVANVVETVNKALIAGGATAQETTSAIRQLSQAFNKGKADGDEFRSMMENAPLLMDLVAAEMGVARHELLLFAEQGKITADVMFRAFSNVAAVQKDFSQVSLTLGGSITQLNNALTVSLGRMNAMTGATSTLATGISVLSMNVDILFGSITALAAAGAIAKLASAAAAGGFVLLGAAAMTAAKAGETVGHMLYNLTTYQPNFVEMRDDTILDKLTDQAAFERASRAMDLLIRKYGEAGAAFITWIKAQDNVTVSVARSIEHANRQLEIQKRINDAVKAGAEENKKMRDIITARVDADRNAVSVNDAIRSAYDKVEGSLTALVLRQKALTELYADRGIEAYGRELVAVNVALEEQRNILNMTADQFSQYIAEQQREIELAVLQEQILSSTVGARQRIADSIEIVNTAMDDGNMLRVDGIRLLELYSSQLDKMNGVMTDTTTTSTRMTVEQRSYLMNVYALTRSTQELTGEFRALNKLYAAGAISQEYYNRRQSAIAVDMWRIKFATESASNATEIFQRVLDGFRVGFLMLDAELGSSAIRIAETWKTALTSMSDGIGDLTARWILFGESMRVIDVFRSVVAQMIRTLVSLTAQYIIVGIARQFAGFGTPQVTTAPALGYSAGPALPAMQSGGYTGGAGVNQIAGVVHGQEFVTNARATRRNRATLEHMNATGNMPLPNITINNNSGVALRAEYIGPDEVRLIAEDVVVRKAPGAIAGSVANPNSSVSRSLRQYTTAGRKGA